jgi:hypothetical protein
MFGSFRKNLTESNYGLIGLELVVLILGILIAFQIDRWAEEIRDRDQEYEYLLRLKEDLQIELQSMDAVLEFAGSRVTGILFLEEVIANPDAFMEQLGAVPVAMEMASWRSFPQINAFVYTELQNSGKLALVRSDILRRELANHYTTIQHYSRFGLEVDAEHHFERLTAGILTTAELKNIEEGSWSNAPSDISKERALEITQEFARRQDAIDLLPSIAQHHIFNKKVVESARNRAVLMIERIDSLIDD